MMRTTKNIKTTQKRTLEDGADLPDGDAAPLEELPQRHFEEEDRHRREHPADEVRHQEGAWKVRDF